MADPGPRVGLGFDVHPWDVEGILSLAGVRFDGVHGLSGHSDGDAVCHALADALLGAAALGDIGEHFPETDPDLAGIAGLDLLGRSVSIVEAARYKVRSCDITVICAVPAISPRREEMRSALARVLGIGVDAVSVKATRPEGLNLAGDGVGCLAVVVVTGGSPTS